MQPSPRLSALSVIAAERTANGVGLIIVPGWNPLSWLWHGFSTRLGGATRVYAGETKGELNLGFTADDERANVLLNRRLLAEAVSGNPDTPIVTVRQIHSAAIQLAGPPEPGQPVCEGDGLITSQSGILIGIQTADCVPVLVADRERRVVAAFHAGWRGTVKRIVENGIARMTREFGSQPHHLVAAIGPAIGPCCYAVGQDLLSEFQSQFGYANELFRHIDSGSEAFPSLHLDLIEANRRQLLDAGLAPESISAVGGCTACQPELFFSHRASGGKAGRMLSVIGVSPSS